ncbi:MAG: HTTM domain-containing protein, partial [Actinobacteria bacterium]|nr:HTTM domain-containing protein [Actinomycetota bacterium]NIW26106.1 HTTM domain-containing protein [Actinomycetota bacterium]NIX18676.1 HTTM domain-containing protein [Actinomycetota bacterium]
MKAAIERRLAALFGGWVSPWPFAILRVGLAAIVLLRTTVFDWLPMDHHGWVAGLEYHPPVDAAEPPAFHSPLWPFLPPLGAGLTAALVWARTALATLLLVGVRPRIVAAALALLGYGLMAADRTRYLHHLHLLWLSVGLLALTPCGERLAPLRRLRWLGDGKTPRRWVPRWSLQLLRFHVLVVYAAAGAAKLDPRWLSGRTLAELHDAGLLHGPLADGALAT